jgi:UDP-N-acetylmuramoyl-tripeptide--D-alanyl-D-alanine ligase
MFKLYLINLIQYIILLLNIRKENIDNIALLTSNILLILNYLLVAVVNIINTPIERGVYYYYWYKARRKLKTLTNLESIGITGSYGKTSSKNILNSILSIAYITHPTPKNFNTDVGLMRTINNDLDKFDEIFIAEMGAYRVGRIKNSCKLVKPKYGLLTTIGKAHLETFKTEENIIRTKFELIESLPSDGIAFLNMDDKKQVNYKLKNKVKVIWYAVDNEKASVYAKNIKCTSKGSEFDVKFKDEDKLYHFETKLLGRHNISNIISSLAVGHEFRIPVEKLQIAVKEIQPIEHRLELKKLGKMYQIDDAYNSNPVGAKIALEVLNMMDGTKVLVTPGMIELGCEQEKANYEFGNQIANVADHVILVGEKQTKPIYDGLIDNKYDKKKIIITNDVRETYKMVNNLKSVNKDIYALYENDLPDNYNELNK